MTPAMPTGVSSPSQMRQSSPVSPRPRPRTPTVRCTPSRVSIDLAGSRPTHSKASAGQEREVVGVGGLAQLEHDVVGRVDHVVDRPHAGEEQPFEPPTRGEGPTVTPLRTVTVKRGHRSVDSTTAVATRSTGRPLGSGAGGSGISNGRCNRLARSRAIPAMLQASGRLPSTVMSNTTSRSRPSASSSGVPGSPGISASRISSPSESSLRPSSVPEQSMPLDVTPRIVTRVIGSSAFGRSVPTGARGTRSPTSKFRAPHTISSGSRAGIDDDQADPVGALDGPDLEHSAHHDVAEALADVLDALDDQPQIVEGGPQHPEIVGERGEVTEPAERCAHVGFSVVGAWSIRSR